MRVGDNVLTKEGYVGEIDKIKYTGFNNSDVKVTLKSGEEFKAASLKVIKSQSELLYHMMDKDELIKFAIGLTESRDYFRKCFEECADEYNKYKAGEKGRNIDLRTIDSDGKLLDIDLDIEKKNKIIEVRKLELEIANLDKDIYNLVKPSMFMIDNPKESWFKRLFKRNIINHNTTVVNHHSTNVIDDESLMKEINKMKLAQEER